MNQINNNSVFLRDQMIDGKYTSEGGVYDTGIKLMCGRAYIPPQAVDVVYGTVYFTNLFTPGMQPVITTSILSNAECKFEHVVYGIGQYWPDHRGFQFKIKINPAYNQQTFNNQIYLFWQAMAT